MTEPDMSACFCPDHKASMVLFLERVYGIEDQAFLLHMLEVGFLPDLQASASLDTVSGWKLPKKCCHIELAGLIRQAQICSKNNNYGRMHRLS